MSSGFEVLGKSFASICFVEYGREIRFSIGANGWSVRSGVNKVTAHLQ